MSQAASRSSQFVVPLRDLDDGPKTLRGEIGVEWLGHALQGTEATPTGEKGSVDLELSKSGQQVLVRGTVAVAVTVPCARTLAPIDLQLKPEILLLLRRVDPPPNRAQATSRHAGRKQGKQAQSLRSAGGSQHAQERHRPGGRSTKSERKGGWEHGAELTSLDAAQDTFEGEQIVLDSFLREFIVLELPMFPVRQDLPSLPVDARASAPGSRKEPGGSDPTPAPARADAESTVDPRLAPLAELKDRLRQQKKQKE